MKNKANSIKERKTYSWINFFIVEHNDMGRPTKL